MGDPMKLTHLSLLLCFSIFPVAIHAQDSSTTPTSGAAPPSAPAASPNAQPASPNPTPTVQTKKPKKVWTNDEIKTVKGGVSVVGDATPSPRYSESYDPDQQPEGKNLHQQQIDNYRSQIQDLQRKIDAVDQRISQLKNFKGENTAPSGGINPNQGYNMVPLEDQVKQLEERKKQYKARIEDVENDAKKNGIAPGDLR
jgi:hypothetical protein